MDRFTYPEKNIGIYTILFACCFGHLDILNSSILGKGPAHHVKNPGSK